jgi:hypothetical protein
MPLGRGNVFGRKLTPEQRSILVRIERGELTALDAERLLTGQAPPAVAAEAEEIEDRADETPEEAAARELVERIAREAYDG